MGIYETRDGFDFTSIVCPLYEKNAIFINPSKTWAEYEEYIKKHGIQQAKVAMQSLSGLPMCAGLKYLYILPPPELKSVDFAPLYEMPEVKYLNCGNHTGDNGQYLSEVDYSYINGLEVLLTDVNRKTKNFNKLDSLKGLGVWSYGGKNGDLEDLFSSTGLAQLQMISCKNSSLYGIERAEGLRCLYLHMNRRLEDISSLGKLGDTLTALRIEACPKISDFSVLHELKNLELLELTGSNSIESLDFIRSMPKLKTLILSMDVLDGNLRPCLDLSYIYVKNRRHYNLKDDDLPKDEYCYGNGDIEMWQRFD